MSLSSMREQFFGEPEDVPDQARNSERAPQKFPDKFPEATRGLGPLGFRLQGESSMTQ